MKVVSNLNIDPSLESFISQWESKYLSEIKKIKLFNEEWSKNLTKTQQKEFIKIFYHARGHFHDFLWYIANHTKDKRVKDVILSNISEELNGSAKSHEQMYLDFAYEFDLDLKDEFVKEEYYIPFIKDFNNGHLRWLAENDEDIRVSTFSAYEKLDNVDYISLLKLARSFNTSRPGLIFFKIHTKVEHFGSTFFLLQEIWEANPEKVKKGFDFIAGHQINLWYSISDHIDKFN